MIEELKHYYPDLHVESVLVGGDYKVEWYKAWSRKQWPREFVGCGMSMEELEKDCWITVKRRRFGH